MSDPFPSNPDEALRNNLERTLAQVGIPPADRRGGRGRLRGIGFDPRRVHVRPSFATLTRRNGVLRWDFGGGAVGAFAVPEPPGVEKRGPRAVRTGMIRGEIVHQFEFEQIEPNKVTEKLTDLDRMLTPHAWFDSPNQNVMHGLWKISNGKLGDRFLNQNDAAGKKIFLFVHGTASNAQKGLNDLAVTEEGRSLLALIEKKYDLALAFDHPTLSVSPILNAVDLAGLLRPTGNQITPPKQIDIVCHSRGGLVTRWFCEAFAEPETMRRAVFVGSPLGGTSLAAPARIKHALDLLTNGADILEGFTEALPGTLTGMVTALLKVFNLAISLAAARPVPDLIISLVPGLAAQQRIGNNGEIDRLRRYLGAAVDGDTKISYSAVTSNFEPVEGVWETIRKAFTNPGLTAAGLGASIAFEGQNDLVVDTESMSELADNTHIKSIESFGGASTTVYHTNYFRQSETVKFIRKTFGL